MFCSGRHKQSHTHVSCIVKFNGSKTLSLFTGSLLVGFFFYVFFSPVEVHTTLQHIFDNILDDIVPAVLKG